MQIEPRPHVYIAGFAPVKPRMESTISPPLTNRARNATVVIQWVTRTRAECRFRCLAAGMAEASLAEQDVWPVSLLTIFRTARC